MTYLKVFGIYFFPVLREQYWNDSESYTFVEKELSLAFGKENVLGARETAWRQNVCLACRRTE